MKLTDEQIAAIRDGCEGATSGPWHPGHLGEPGRCQCTSILSETGIMGAVASVHVDNGLKISDGGNDAPPKDQAAANMRHIARCDPNTIRTLATEVLETRALLASLDVDRLEEIITDSIDLDWTPRTAARAIVRAMGGTSHE